MVWYHIAVVWYEWCGMIWSYHGMVWMIWPYHGMVWYEWYGHTMVWYCMVWIVWPYHGMVLYGMSGMVLYWYGMVWFHSYGMVWFSPLWICKIRKFWQSCRLVELWKEVVNTLLICSQSISWVAPSKVNVSGICSYCLLFLINYIEDRILTEVRIATFK